MNTSGESMVSNPAEWCSPIHASWKPSSSIHSHSRRSRSIARVGFSASPWKGARKMPCRSGMVMAQLYVPARPAPRPAMASHDGAVPALVLLPLGEEPHQVVLHVRGHQAAAAVEHVAATVRASAARERALVGQ